MLRLPRLRAVGVAFDFDVEFQFGALRFGLAARRLDAGQPHLGRRTDFGRGDRPAQQRRVGGGEVVPLEDHVAGWMPARSAGASGSTCPTYTPSPIASPSCS